MIFRWFRKSWIGLVGFCVFSCGNGAFAEDAASKVEAAKSFFETTLGVEIAWIATIVSVVLGIIPLILYVQERKKSSLLDSLLKQYNLSKQLETDAERAATSKSSAEEALSKSKQELATLTKQLEESIPNQARAAFFTAAIPEVDRQMLYLQEQRKAMERGLADTGVPTVDSARLKPVLQTEINQTVVARRKLEEKQTILSIVTGLAAGSAAVTIFYEVQYVLRILFGIAILWCVFGLCYQWTIVYPDNRLSRLMTPRGLRILLTIVAASIMLFLLFILVVVLANRGRYG